MMEDRVPVNQADSLSVIDIVFRSAAAAEYRVAGIPAAARAARGVAEAFAGEDIRCIITAEGSWTPGAGCRAECRRLARGLHLVLGGSPAPGALRIDGEALVAALADLAPGGDVAAAVQLALAPVTWGAEDPALALRHASRTIIAGTGKATDGIVSRYLNRRISQRITRTLLRCPGITPFHATLGTATLGLAMILSLLLGGHPGLILGAILFQAASIFDGVDGEMARATWRTSDRGAMLDSLVDALTNLAFVTGVTVNLALSGDMSASLAGAAGLVMLASGLFLIGRRAKASGQPVNFDVIKGHVGKRRSAVMQWLIWLTMRDFFAAVAALLIILGLTRLALFAFAIVAAGWLVVTVTVLVRTSRRHAAAAKRPDDALRGGYSL
ncbi:CDP-alcohol phosphatidyltransferase family protein [Sphingomonas olei]|uniref:CDP-alcohol phosphatidyltransferase family protein n=1 Tax=Sphingomonas olei TaxID=1886787 RepID=A0ABY2QFW2_9SPHN|nr:CDP-alcohol phosphatidyltransferase family protein [Sphingomonas olei]